MPPKRAARDDRVPCESVACCAFALFILGQIAAGFVALRRAVPFGLLGQPAVAATLNPTTAWQLGSAEIASAALTPSPRLAWRTVGRAVALVALLEIAGISAVAAWTLHDAHASADASVAQNRDTLWCGRMLP
jgi:hypothetical protein